MKKQYLISLVLVLTSLLSLWAQGTIEDYKRAEAADKLFRNKVFNSPASFDVSVLQISKRCGCYLTKFSEFPVKV